MVDKQLADNFFFISCPFWQLLFISTWPDLPFSLEPRSLDTVVLHLGSPVAAHVLWNAQLHTVEGQESKKVSQISSFATTISTNIWNDLDNLRISHNLEDRIGHLALNFFPYATMRSLSFPPIGTFSSIFFKHILYIQHWYLLLPPRLHASYMAID